MKNFFYLIVAMMMALFATSAWAEQGCPPGQYPIGGQGAVACAPIPQESPIQQQPRPSGKWIKTWGAIASDGVDNLGVSTGKLKKSQAEQDALQKCESASSGNCHVALAYINQCAAVGEPIRRGDMIRSMTRGPSIEAASQYALVDCQKKNSGEKCQIIYTACTEPVFQEF